MEDKDYTDVTEFWKNEIIAFLALTCLKGVGYWTLRKIYASKLGFKNLLKGSSADALASYLRVALPKDISWEDFQKELWSKGIERARELNKQGISLYFYDQVTFPSALKNIPEPPFWIFVHGNKDILNKKSLAIVGTRKPTDDGIFLVKLIVSRLCGLDIVTVSGLATGIDQACHLESVRYGIPTIAVLGNGLLVEYPKGSKYLYDEIVRNNGAIVSEYLPEQNYSAENFVRRNRIQAALSTALIPVEWKVKSGTAHTVEYAFKYSKKIANPYLPKTYSFRPELKFAEDNRNAKSFEVPINLDDLIDYVINDENIINAQPIQQDLDL
ncbi:DNA-protecting protein DprA [Cronobacter sakazakii]|uniref:DNA-processing protein DprA n=1 Tax=Cronobacter sakazakii TaxID=28141 RepID=UPI001BA866A7|nr:DNA-processing protein DprA [Cronobacter sakazakii]EKK7716533.1 DNA-protecting protein DprA [Cronobacter dublinensis]ELQ6121997.1 DNA-protecting protein DprA [Cronobacter sakazakii]ELQ6154315.1 DNA-protecting protein DprA [Cronobacter sakazakii]ELQ6163276.1 DNA-protecting protein DprA [Cronobacter sakazakii]MBR9958546.1 DNA-protecting protein DprA [Cronobacter sakazakii]